MQVVKIFWFIVDLLHRRQLFFKKICLPVVCSVLIAFIDLYDTIYHRSGPSAFSLLPYLSFLFLSCFTLDVFFSYAHDSRPSPRDSWPPGSMERQPVLPWGAARRRHLWARMMVVWECKLEQKRWEEGINRAALAAISVRGWRRGLIGRVGCLIKCVAGNKLRLFLWWCVDYAFNSTGDGEPGWRCV